jgi:hypothetical protein
MNVRGSGRFAGSHVPNWMRKGLGGFLKAVQLLLALTALFIGVLIVGYLASLAGMYFVSPEDYYSSIYNVPKDHVYIQAEPHDCEWEKAPIGKKYCHYEKRMVHDENQVVVTWVKVDD